MSTVTVGNIHFESTANSRINYSANSITMSVGGANVFTANSTQFSILVSANVTPGVQTSTGTITANTISINSNGNIQVYGQYVLNGTVTPAVISANTSAWAPGITNTSIIRVSANSSVNLPIYVYGMTAGTNGQVVILSNIGTKAISFENESLVETTAGNRFSLPQTVNLNGYQSVSLIYDGTAARWKSLDLNYLGYYRGLLNKGFFSGGLTPASVQTTTTDRTTFSSETNAVVPGASLLAARQMIGAAGDGSKSFFAGGCGASGRINNLCRVTYSSETTAAATGINQGRAEMAAAGSCSKAFFVGGYAAGPVGDQLTAERTSYSSETTALVPTANISVIKRALMGIGSNCKGFFGGGYKFVPAPTVIYATTCRTSYSSETTAAVPGANLSQARQNGSTTGNENKGFILGGKTPTIVSTVNRLDFTTETYASITALPTNRSCIYGGISNVCKGFISGGFNGAVTAAACRTSFTTETTAAVPGANLSQIRVGVAGSK